MFEDQNQNPQQPQNPQQNAQPGPAEDIFAETEAGNPAPAQSSGAANPPAHAPAAPQAQPPPQTTTAQPGPPTALAGGKLQAKEGEASAGVPSGQASGAAFPYKKMLIIAGSSVGVIVIAVVGFFVMRNNSSQPASTLTPPPPSETQNTIPEPEDTTPEEPEQPQEPDQDTEEGDEDGAGVVGDFLKDFQDKSMQDALDPLNQDLTRIDTDQDGLSDAQEFDLETNPRLVDSDNDGLSDWEEHAIFGTDPLNDDTDGDTYLDGEEVQNGYDPNGSGKLLNFEQTE